MSSSQSIVFSYESGSLSVTLYIGMVRVVLMDRAREDAWRLKNWEFEEERKGMSMSCDLYLERW